MNLWHLYILDCDGRFFYTGVSTDVDRRISEHRSGKGVGARATRGAVRIRVAYSVAVGTRSLAQKAESRVKKLSRRQKAGIVARQWGAAELMAYLGLAPGVPTGRRSDEGP